jgi:DNA-binding response OmpR family regulator
MAQAEFAVSLDNQTVTVCGIVFRMSPQETAFLYTLDQHRGEYVSTGQIVQAIWGGGEIPLGADQIIARYAREVRRFLLPFSIQIENMAARGYKLILPE